MPTTALFSDTASAAFVLGATCPTNEDYRGRGLGFTHCHMGGDNQAESYPFGARKDTVEGTPASPCLALDFPGTKWSFRWVVAPGNRSITIFVKQAGNQSPRPSVTLREDASIGLAAAVTQSAASSTGWVSVTLSFVCTAVGSVWVDLQNNNWLVHGVEGDPCFFDRISVT